MATTTPDNIRTPDAGDQYALVQDLGALADTTQAAFIKRANMYVGTAAQRTAFTTAPEGVHWQDTNGSKFEYVRQGGAWIAWVTPPSKGNTVLWEGTGVYMQGSQSVTLSDTVANQPTGVILRWQEYTSGNVINAQFNYTHIPKVQAGRAGGIGCPLAGISTSVLARKYVYLDNDKVRGHDSNSVAPANGWVLTGVYGY